MSYHYVTGSIIHVSKHTFRTFLGIQFPFTIKGVEQTTLVTYGKLSCSVGWAVDENGALLVPPSIQLAEGVVR